MEYLEMFYNLRQAGRGADKAGRRRLRHHDRARTARRAAHRQGRRGDAAPEASKHVYDAVVLDAPPTGRIGRFLNVTSEVSGLARVGPIRNHATPCRR